MKSKSIGSIILLALLAPSCGGGGSSKTPNVTASALERWGLRFRTPTTANLRAVRFNDIYHGLVAGDAGTILLTQDAGNTWQSLDTTPANRTGNITAISALGRSIVAVGADAVSGGRNWYSDNTFSYTTDDVPGLNAPAVFSDVAVLVGASSGQPRVSLHLRSDGNLDLYQPTYSSITIDTSANTPNPPSTWLRSNAMFIGPNGTSGWIVGSKAGPAAQIRYTQSDVTGLWKDGTVPGGTPGLNAVWMLGLMLGFCCGDAGTVLQTADGITWTALAGTPPGGLGTTTFRAIQMADVNTGWVVGDDGTNGCIYKLTFSSPNWVWSSKISTPDKLYGLNVVSGQVAYAVGDNGLVMRTTDGTTWINLRTPNPVVTPQFNAIDFSADGTIGLAAGNGGIVYRTMDSGVTWTAFNSGIPGALNVLGVCIPRHGSGTRAYLCGTNSVYVNTTLASAVPAAWSAQTVAAGAYQAILFPNGDLKGACVGGASIVYTTDGGATATSWNAPTTPPVGNYRALACNPAGSTLYAAGDAGVVSSSANLGNTWTAMTTVPSTPNLLSIQAPAGAFNTLFVGSDAGNVYHLPASSSTWASSTVLAASPVAALAFSGDLNGFAVVQGATPGIFTTSDGGTTWQQSTLHFTTAPVLRAAWENSSRLGFVAGDNGIILRTETGGQ